MNVGTLEIELMANVARLQRDMDQARSMVGRTTDEIQRMANAAKAALGTIGAGIGLAQIAALSDQYAKYTAQLKLATQSEREYAKARADVRRIAADAQTDLAATGVLYARITKGTSELGLSQQRLSNITEVVALSLKASGATAQESASAQLQLSQAFAAGALRGEEFNAVNEAAPRLMQALADGIGVPVGALKQMASEGKITSQVMAEALPKALGELREEATQVQTIAGAFQLLKNSAMEFVGTQAEANGMVAALTSGVTVLANNLPLVAGAALTVAAVKLGNWALDAAKGAYSAITANRALVAANLATAESHAAAAVEASMLANMRMYEASAATLAARGDVQLALATNALIPAQTRAAAAAQAQTVALAELAVAQRAASLGSTAASVATGALGGPLGILIAVLGVAATAWSWYQSKQDEANRNAVKDTEQSTAEIVASLEKQNSKLRERLELQRLVGISPQDASPAADRMAAVLAQINELTAKKTALDMGEQAQLYALGLEYNNLTVAMEKNKQLRGELDATGKAATDLIAVRERLTGVNKQYLEDLTKLQTALEKGAVSQDEYKRLVTLLATETWKSSDAGKAATSAATKETEAYQNLISEIRSKIDEDKIALALGENATESQKMAIKLDQELAAGKRQLASDHLKVVRAAIAAKAVTEEELKQRDAQRELTKWIVASTNARNLSAAALGVEYAMYGQSNDAREIAMVRVRAEADAQKKLDEMRAEGKPISDQMIAQLNAETAARVRVEQATMAQSKALAYATQLREENKRFGLEYIADDKARAAAQLRIDNDMWQERIRLAGDGTEAQKLLQQEYATWYRNQSIKPQLDEQKRMWSSFEQTAHDTFLSIQNGAKSFADRLRETLKNGVFEWLYQMTLRKWIINVQGVVSGSGGIGGAQGSTSFLESATSLFSMGKTIFSGFSSSFMGTMGSYVTKLGGMFGSSTMASFGSGMSASVAGSGDAAMYASALRSGNLAKGASSGMSFGSGAWVGTAGWIAAGMALANGLYQKGWDPNNGSISALNRYTAPIANESMLFNSIFKGIGLSNSTANLLSGASIVSALFGRKNPEIESRGLQGTVSAAGFDGKLYANIVEKGGLFRSTKRYQNTADLTVAQDAAFDATLRSMLIAVKGFGAALGVETAQIDGYTKAINLQLTGDDTKDQELVAKLFGDIGDELSTRLIPNLAEFSQTGETASQTLQRLAGDFEATNQVAQMLGKSAVEVFGSVNMESAKARERLIELAGGVQTLTQQASFYAQNFLSEEERLKPVSESLAAAMASLGLSSIQSREAFKQHIDELVSSGRILTDEGAKEYASVMKLVEAFALVHPEIDATADALQNMKDAASTLLGDVDSAFSVLQSVVAREKAALQPQIDAVTASINKLRSLSDALHSAVDSMRVPQHAAEDRAAAQAQIKAWLAIAKAGGPLPESDSVKKALGVVTQDAASQFATYQDYLRDFYTTQNDIASLANLSDDALSVDEQSLKALQDQVKQMDDMLASEQQVINALKGLDTSVLTIPQAIEALKAVILNARANPVVSATEAINKAYQSALGRSADSAGMDYWKQQAANGSSVENIVKAISGSAEAKVQAMYHSLLGRGADAAGLQYWLKSGASMDQIGAAIKDSAEYKKLHPFAVGINRVPRNMPAFLHEDEAVVPAALNPFNPNARANGLGGNTGRLEALIEALTSTVEQQQEELVQIRRDTKRQADGLQIVTNGWDAMRTTTETGATT